MPEQVPSPDQPDEAGRNAARPATDHCQFGQRTAEQVGHRDGTELRQVGGARLVLARVVRVDHRDDITGEEGLRSDAHETTHRCFLSVGTTCQKVAQAYPLWIITF